MLVRLGLGQGIKFISLMERLHGTRGRGVTKMHVFVLLGKEVEKDIQ